MIQSQLLVQPSSLTTDQKIEIVNTMIRSLANSDQEAAQIAHHVCVINQLIYHDLSDYQLWQGEFDLETAKISESELEFLRIVAGP